MKPVVTGKEMKKIDTYTIEQIGIPSLVLMERAAWSMIQRMLPFIEKHTPIVSVCGAGNNGGDAVAAARILYGMGYHASIYMAGNSEKWTQETKKQILIARNIGVPEYNELDLSRIEVVIDGLFGIGLSSDIREPYAQIIKSINCWRASNSQSSIWSVDIPSGICSDTGRILGQAVKADYTVTFGYMKRGLILNPGKGCAGICYVEDIGFPEKSLKEHPVQCFYMAEEDLSLLPKRLEDSNKGDYGKILVVAGSKNMSGAAYFAAKAAYTMGAGLVRVLTEEANRIIIQTQLPQAMVSVWEELTNETFNEIFNWADAVVVGPGIGTSDVMKQRIEKVFSKVQCPLIVDADGLNLLAKNEIWYDKLNVPVIVTPHMGEMSRLTGKTIQTLKRDRVNYAMNYAQAYNVCCVLKDSSSVITDGQHVCLNCTGNDGMATGGSGDVLSGIIGALAGMRLDPFKAACLGAMIHGMAGDIAAKYYGKRSMTSVELIEGLIEVLK